MQGHATSEQREWLKAKKKNRNKHINDLYKGVIGLNKAYGSNEGRRKYRLLNS